MTELLARTGALGVRVARAQSAKDPARVARAFADGRQLVAMLAMSSPIPGGDARAARALALIDKLEELTVAYATELPADDAPAETRAAAYKRRLDALDATFGATVASLGRFVDKMVSEDADPKNNPDLRQAVAKAGAQYGFAFDLDRFFDLLRRGVETEMAATDFDAMPPAMPSHDHRPS